MTALSLYLMRLFSAGSLSFFGVATLLVYIMQTLRLFDLVTAKGQDIFTLFGQSALNTPAFAVQILYICMGVGLARALLSLQSSHELHAIHSSGRLSALWLALAGFVFGGVALALLLSNWVEPAANRSYADWSTEVAADLVGRSLNPHRFSEVVPGLVIVIGGRDRDGTVRDFFANDQRDPKSQRTYMAKSAVIAIGNDGYNLSLRNGAIHYQQAGSKFTAINFARYDLSLDRLVQSDSRTEQLDQKNTWRILTEAGGFSGLDTEARFTISRRLAEGTRLAGLCLFVFSLMAFPSGRRKSTRMPFEVIVVILALCDRSLGGLLAPTSPWGHHFGAMIFLGMSAITLALQVYGARLPSIRQLFGRQVLA